MIELKHYQYVLLSSLRLDPTKTCDSCDVFWNGSNNTDIDNFERRIVSAYTRLKLNQEQQSEES